MLVPGSCVLLDLLYSFVWKACLEDKFSWNIIIMVKYILWATE